MEKLELKHIVGYLPYNLQVQYWGIINSKELGAYEKKYKKENPDDFFKETEYNPPESIEGFKIGFIRIAEFWNTHVNYFIGNKKFGLVSNYGVSNFKLILRPMSDLTNDTYDFIYNKECDYTSILNWLELDNESKLTCKFSFEFWQLLYEHKFDIHGLIEKGLAIDINTIQNGKL